MADSRQQPAGTGDQASGNNIMGIMRNQRGCGSGINLETLLVVLLCPLLVVALLNVILRKRGGISPGWGGVLVIFDKIRI